MDSNPPTPQQPQATPPAPTPAQVMTSSNPVQQPSTPAPASDISMQSSAMPAAPVGLNPVPAPEPTTAFTAPAQPAVESAPQTPSAQPTDMNNASPDTAPAAASVLTSDSSQGAQMQSPSVFDTTQYHLPIEKPKKHNASKQMLVFGIVFLVVLIIGAVIAMDAGIINLGFKLPFDLIK